MQTKTVSFRIDSGKVEQLDSIAAAQQRDRSFLLNEAIDNYLSVQEEQRLLIKEGIRQADAGMLTPLEQVREEAKGWGRGK